MITPHFVEERVVQALVNTQTKDWVESKHLAHQIKAIFRNIRETHAWIYCQSLFKLFNIRFRLFISYET